MAPQAAQGLPVLGLGLDGDATAGQPPAGQALVQLGGQGLGREGGGVHPLGGWVQLHLHSQVRWRLPPGGGALVEAPGKAVGQCSLGTEASQHVGPRQGGERTQGADAQAHQQVGQLGALQDPHREGRQEGGRLARRHHDPPPGGQPGGERPVGDPHPAPGIRHPRDGRGDPGGQRLVTPEVAGRAPSGDGAHAGAHDLDSRREGLQGHHHRFEDPSVAGRVVLDDHELGAAALGLPPAHPSPHSLGPGGSRAGHHPVGEDHGHRFAFWGGVSSTSGGSNSGSDRPVGAPHHQGANRQGADR